MNAPATTVANPNWFRAGDVNRPRVQRARLHRQLLDDARAAAPDAASERRAVIINGSTASERSSVVEDALGVGVSGYLHIDVDRFAAALLAAEEDHAGDVEVVLDEAYALAERLRDAALRDGINLVIDTNFTDTEQAIAFGRQIADAGYRIDVVDIQPSVPSTTPASEASRQLAVNVDAVTTYRRLIPVPSDGRLQVDTDLARAAIGGPLVEASAARARATASAGTPPLAPHRSTGNGRDG